MMEEAFLTLVIIVLLALGGIAGSSITRQQTVDRICSFIQSTENDYATCRTKSYDDTMFVLYRRLLNDN